MSEEDRPVTACEELVGLGHFRFRGCFMHNASPFAGQIQQHLVLLVSQGRSFDSFRLNHLALIFDESVGTKLRFDPRFDPFLHDTGVTAKAHI